MNDRQVSASACGCATVSFVGVSRHAASLTTEDGLRQLPEIAGSHIARRCAEQHITVACAINSN